ncbi:Protein kinase-like domain protein [Fusarium austroafricanum]|uniref:Protein kinase-like domain protein n=1 Tax=Fusarium austroafricanum TaxID=2364996 RepID=A0A8H4NWS3_9HYPO|nr:Protein kinase-like domain protein [Fusarium austroafricanum]
MYSLAAMECSLYSMEDEISNFFAKTSASRAECDERAEELVGGKATPVKVQGVCSYTLYAGPCLDYIVQFRLEPSRLNMKIISLASEVYGTLAPTVSFQGQIGQASDESNVKKPLYVYLMHRMKGVTHLDFILARECPENSPEAFAQRGRLMADVARFFALSWKAAQPVDQTYHKKVRERLVRELGILLKALPVRLHRITKKCIDSIDDILSLPMVLLHRDFSAFNIMVDQRSSHLVGVIDWAEAEIGPFGLDLHFLQSITGKLHYEKGWTRYDDYDSLQQVFWTTFKDEVGGLSDDRIEAIQLSRITGLLLSEGFTNRFANDCELVPIGDDERGRYNMLSLDGFLINPSTMFEGIE